MRTFMYYLLMTIAAILGGVYYIACLVGYANESAVWLVAALIIPPLDLFYPIAAIAFGQPFPIALASIGGVALVLSVLGGMVDD